MNNTLIDPVAVRHDAVIPAGEPWIHEIIKGQHFRIIDLEGNQAADTLFFNADDYEDRYSAQDTIRAQGNIYLTTGTKLMSSKGNVLLTIVATHADGTIRWAAPVRQRATWFDTPSKSDTCMHAGKVS